MVAAVMTMNAVTPPPVIISIMKSLRQKPTTHPYHQHYRRACSGVSPLIPTLTLTFWCGGQSDGIDGGKDNDDDSGGNGDGGGDGADGEEIGIILTDEQFKIVKIGNRIY